MLEDAMIEWDRYAYDQDPIIKVVTSSSQFEFSFHDFIWVKSSQIINLVFEVTDLDYKNQTWIAIDYLKYVLTIFNVTKEGKSVIVSFTTGVEFSFILEVSLGKWRDQNWTTCKVNSVANTEKCYDKDVKISAYKNKINENTIDFKTILCIFFVIALILFVVSFLAFSIYCFLKYILSRVLINETNNASVTQSSHLPLSNEMSVIAFKVDPLTDFRRTSFQSSIRIKVEEEAKRLESKSH